MAGRFSLIIPLSPGFKYHVASMCTWGIFLKLGVCSMKFLAKVNLLEAFYFCYCNTSVADEL